MSRGLRNNNPGNIRLSKIKYLGEIPSTDSAFKQFKTMAWGYRAMFVLLHTYQLKHGCNTLRDMISPAIAEMCGVFPIVREEDLDKITAKKITQIYKEVSLSQEQLKALTDQTS